MSFPLYMNDAFGFPTGLLFAVVIGFGFGYVLENAGFGRAPILAAQFYGENNRVLKVMFTAIATALVGLALLSGLGVVNLDQVTVPATYVWPQLVGGVVFGAGFVVAGYCPGTSVAAAASGKWDGLVTYAGVALGSIVFGLMWPFAEGFYTSGSLGAVRFDQLLGIPFPVLAVAVLLIAAGAFLAVEKLEAVIAEKKGTERPDVAPGKRNRVLGGLALAAAGAVVMLAVPGETPAETVPEKAFRTVSAVDLAEDLSARPKAYFVVDLRPGEACQKKSIPGAMCLPADDADGAFMATLPATRTLVVYGQAEVTELPEAAKRFGGDVLALSGGFDAFDQAILTTPAVPEDPTPEAIARYRLLTALNGKFTGKAAETKAVVIVPKAIAPPKVKKGGGC